MPAMPKWWNRVRDWLESGDERPIDPDAMVEIATVNFAVSEVVVLRLEESGIRALSIEHRSLGGEGTPMARIVCSAGRLEEARRIVDDILTRES